MGATHSQGFSYAASKALEEVACWWALHREAWHAERGLESTPFTVVAWLLDSTDGDAKKSIENLARSKNRAQVEAALADLEAVFDWAERVEVVTRKQEDDALRSHGITRPVLTWSDGLRADGLRVATAQEAAEVEAARKFFNQNS